MFIWNHPTTVYAGEQTAEAFATHTRVLAKNVVVIADANVLEHTPVVETVRVSLAAAGVSTRLAKPVRGAPTPTLLHQFRDDITANRPDAVMAIGGGATLDTAKLVAAGIRSPGCLSSDILTEAHGGLVRLPLGERVRPPHVFAVPTTIGTGSEVSVSACVDVGGAKVLVQHPSLRPAIARLDPLAVATTPLSTVLEGALEVVMRCIGLTVGEDVVHPVQDRVSLAAARGVVADGCQLLAGDETARHRLALASAHTHTGWLMTGRAPYAHMLWFLASEVAQALRITKIQATAGLLGTYFSWLDAGKIPGALGPRSVRVVLDEVLAGRFDSITDLLRAWDLPTTLPAAADPDLLALRTHALWSHRSEPLRGWSPATLACFYRHAQTRTRSQISINTEGR